MRVLGIEFAGSEMRYVVLADDHGVKTVTSSSRLVVGETRSRTALVAFQNAVITLINDTAPDRIAIKSKPESGHMRAGAPALKMEGIVLANSPCDVDFVSGHRVNVAVPIPNQLHGYLQTALRTAIAACLG